MPATTSVYVSFQLDHLHEDLDHKREHVSNLFSKDNIDSFVIKDVFATLEVRVHLLLCNYQE